MLVIVQGRKEKMTFWFYCTEEETRLMAVFVAQLVKEDVVFTIKKCMDRYEITLTGGY